MASISSMISLIVILLATYSYSAPVVPDLQNATSTMQVENATVDFNLENLVILARRDTSNVDEEKRGNETVGLSSSSSEDETVQTTDTPSPREFEDASFPSSSETNAKRDVDTEVNSSFDDNNNSERSFTEDSLSTEENNKRGADYQSFDEEENERSFTEENTKRGIEVESFESSTVDETSVAPSSQVENVKRSLDNSPWLADNGSWSSVKANDETERKKRSSDNGQWLADESNAEAQKRSYEDVQLSTDAVEDSSVPSTSEVANTKRGMEQSSSFSAENEEFNQRGLGPMRSASRNVPLNRGMQQSSSFSSAASNQFNRRAIGSVEVSESSTVLAAKILSESTTDEQPSSSTAEVSSTLENETTVAPVDEYTSASPLSSESKSKILAIIPGQISRSQLVVDPATGTTAGFRPMKQVQLSQGQNQTITEEKKPYH